MAKSVRTQSGAAGGWERLPSARLTPGGPGTTDVVGWLTRGALALLVLAIAWLGFSAVRPLSAPDAPSRPEIHAARPISPPQTTVAQRETLLNSVTGTNWFDPSRQLWTYQEVAKAEPETPKPAEPAPKAAPPGPSDTPTSAEVANGILNPTAPDDLPQQLADAYKNLELRGIRLRADGKLVAMISTVKAPSRPATNAYAIGESFTDKDFSDAPWRILFIDRVHDRVFLQREGKTVELALWTSPSLRVADAEDGKGGSAGASRDEIIAQLRAAGISEEEIANVLGLAEEGAPKSGAQADATPAREIGTTIERIEKDVGTEKAGGVTEMLKKMSETDTRTRRSERKNFSFPSVDTYGSVGGGHSVKSIDDATGRVVLEDGSQWDVSPSDAKLISGWGASAAISVWRGRGTARPYVIANEFTKVYVEASHNVDATQAADADSSGG